MQPNNQTSRDRQFATLGDIKMVAENIGSIESNHRNLVGNINDVIQWVRSIDQAAFIAIHVHVNGSLEFTEETTSRTTAFIEEGRQAMEDYQKEQDAKALAEAREAMGDEFVYEGKTYKKTVADIEATDTTPAGKFEKYTENDIVIPQEQFETIARQAFILKKQEEEKAAAELANQKQIADNEAKQAPADTLAPETEKKPKPAKKEPKDGDVGKKSK